MARQMNNQSNGNQWVQVVEGVSIRKGNKDRISINWFGAVIHGVRIVNGKNGKFLGWPSFKGTNGDYIQTAYIYAPKDSEDAKIVDKIVSML